MAKWLDVLWKSVLIEGFDDALDFFMPELAAARDVSRATQLENGELLPIGGESDKGMRISDLIFSVPLKGGPDQRVVFVLEQQHRFDRDFARRMFEEYYRLTDRLHLPVTLLAIFTGKERMPDGYERSCFGTVLSFRYNSYRVADVDIELLRRDERVFAVVMLASALMLRAGGKPAEREKYVRELLQLMRERGYTMAKRRMIMSFISRVFQVRRGDMSEALRREWNMIAIPLEKAIEEIQLKNAYENGMEIGVEQGKVDGKVEVARRMLARGVTLDIIEDTTGLPKEKIVSL